MKKKKTIRVVYVEPGEYARVVDIGNTLQDLKNAVGGYIEVFNLKDSPDIGEICVVCNEEGKLDGLTPCRAIYGDKEKIVDVICGPFFICGSHGESFASLDEKQIEHYIEKFRYPERFSFGRDSVQAVPYDPQRDRKKER